MRVLWVVFAFVVAMLSTAGGAHAEKRVALVIGNAEYVSIGRLSTPTSDAGAIALLLAKNGFAVKLLTDLTGAEMASALGDFRREADGSDLGVFYYAGHGIQLRGENYILPVDFDLTSDANLQLNGITLQAILASTMAGVKQRVLLLDACRNDPFLHRAMHATRSIRLGFSSIEMIQAQTAIAFATAPGSEAFDGYGHSPFAEAVLSHLTSRDMSIQEAFNSIRRAVLDKTNGEQGPWTQWNLVAPLYLAGQGRSLYTDAALADLGAQLSLWQQVRAADREPDYVKFLQTFTAGTLNVSARASLAYVRFRSEKGSSETEKSLILASEDWKILQKVLADYGFAPGPNDGIVKASTRRAVSRWQSSEDLAPTGYLNKGQYELLLAKRKVAATPDPSLQQPGAIIRLLKRF